MARAWLVALLLLGASCAKQDWIDRTLVTVDVTGTWHGTTTGPGTSVAESGTQELWLDLEQAGSKVTGAARFKPDQGMVQSGPIGAPSLVITSVTDSYGVLRTSS